jgi:hypothetical protein
MLSRTHKGKVNTTETRKKMGRSRTGDRNPRWRGGRYVAATGYVLVLRHDHPRSNRDGHVLEHILIAEETLGRPLACYGRCHRDNEVVHHKNGVRHDNRPENLEIMTHGEHTSMHLRERTKW